MGILIYGKYNEFYVENKVTGTVTCSHITAFSWSEEFGEYAGPEVAGWRCESDAIIMVRLSAYTE